MYHFLKYSKHKGRCNSRVPSDELLNNISHTSITMCSYRWATKRGEVFKVMTACCSRHAAIVVHVRHLFSPPKGRLKKLGEVWLKYFCRLRLNMLRSAWLHTPFIMLKCWAQHFSMLLVLPYIFLFDCYSFNKFPRIFTVQILKC